MVRLGAEIGIGAATAHKNRKNAQLSLVAQQELTPRQARFLVMEKAKVPPETLAVPCQPSCIGRECGSDGCGGSCGECGPEGTTQSGIVHKRLRLGLGASYPHQGSLVVIRFVEQVFRNRTITRSISSGKSFTVPLRKLIPPMREAIQMMVKAEQRRFVIPAELFDSAPADAAGTAYTFDITLFAFGSANR